MSSIQRQLNKLPETPGVYLYRNAEEKILYIGKAANLKRRVSSYFTRPHDARIEKLVGEIKKIECKKTDSALEALVLEAVLIKKHQPLYNISQKDDKSFLYVKTTRERFPRLVLVRGKDLFQPKERQSKEVRLPNMLPDMKSAVFGPFVSGGQLREALRIVRRIFPWHVHTEEFLTRNKNKPCFERQIGLCPGTCAGGVNPKEYGKTIRNITLLFRGRKKAVIRSLEREMKAAAKVLRFERAAKIKKQIFALRHIQDVALISDSNNTIAQSRGNVPEKRIEGYDISNISGASAVGSMVVFVGGKPDRSQYRKFKIRTVAGSNDIGMLREVLARRLKHREWPLPDIILVDGGKPQLNVASAVLNEHNLKLPVVGIAKGPERKRNDLYGTLPAWIDKITLIKIRNEAHRSALSYHRIIRSRALF